MSNPRKASIFLKEKCPCVCDRSRNPYRIDERADEKCLYCGGTGILSIETSHEFPPIPTRSCDYSAWVSGTEEQGPQGYGETRTEAVEDLLSALSGVLA